MSATKNWKIECTWHCSNFCKKSHLKLSLTLENKMVLAHHIYRVEENTVPFFTSGFSKAYWDDGSPLKSSTFSSPLPQITNWPGYSLARALNSVKNIVSFPNKVVCNRTESTLKKKNSTETNKYLLLVYPATNWTVEKVRESPENLWILLLLHKTTS